jgi:hypothetical protein
MLKWFCRSIYKEAESMSSIFIWKTESALPPNCSTIRYYHGIDWFSQENSDTSYTYQYIAQDIYPDYIVYTAKKMRDDWVGDDVLEVNEIAYHPIYQSNGIIIQQIGSWMQCIYDSDDSDVDTTWKMIQSILLNPSPVSNSSSPREDYVKSYGKYVHRQVERNNVVRGERGGRGGRGGRGRGRGGHHRAIARI